MGFPHGGGLLARARARRMRGMSEFTVDISALHEAGCTGVELTVASRAADVVQLEFVSDVVGAVPVPWRHGDCVTLMDGEVVLARGWVLDSGVQLGAESYDFSVQLGNVVALMDAVPYAEGQGFRGYVQDEMRLVSAAEMVGVLARAGAKAPGGGDSGDAVVVDFEASIKCPTGSGSQSCWSLVEDVLHWVPDAVSFYEPAERRLSFCRAGGRGELVVDVGRGVAVVPEWGGAAVAAAGWLRISASPWPPYGLKFEIGGVLCAPNVYGGGVCSAAQWVDMLNGIEGLPVVAEVDAEDVYLVRLVAKVPGAAGNEVALRWIEGDGYSFSGEFLAGGRDAVDLEVFRFGGVESAGFRPRFDLCPPVVGMVWGNAGGRQEFVLPEGGDLRQPWAFLYELPEVGGAGMGEVLTEVQKGAVRDAAAQRMEVEGLPVPVGWVSTGNMREVSAGALKGDYDFWGRWFPELRRTGMGCLQFGQAVFEPVDVDVAFPPQEDGATMADGSVERGQPVNYEEFGVEAQRIYVLNKGEFPASAERRDNVSGLSFCYGVYKQYVWLAADYVGSLSEEERKEFFKGCWSVKLADGSRHATRYALLTLRAVFINRRRKRFMTGTNELLDGDDDFSSDGGEEDEVVSGGDSVSTADYKQAVTDYYNATRRLMWDGSICLTGGEGVRLGELVGRSLCVTGLRDEWAAMNTPVQAVVWRPFEGQLVLTSGSTELLTVDERVARMQMGRRGLLGGGSTLPPDAAALEEPGVPVVPEGEDAGAGSFAMVAPSVAANQEARAEGRPLNPFEVFQEGERWFMNEGVWPAWGELIQFETTDVTEKKALYDRLGVDVDFDAEGKPVLVVRGYGKKVSS